MQSLLGMLAFSGSLALAARALGAGDLDAAGMTRVLPGYVLAAAVVWAALALTARAVSRG